MKLNILQIPIKINIKCTFCRLGMPIVQFGTDIQTAQ